jgi:hypothetical protein
VYGIHDGGCLHPSGDINQPSLFGNFPTNRPTANPDELDGITIIFGFDTPMTFQVSALRLMTDLLSRRRGHHAIYS